MKSARKLTSFILFSTLTIGLVGPAVIASPAMATEDDSTVNLEQAAKESYSITTDVAKTNVASAYASPLTAKSYWISSYFGPRCPVALGAGVFHGAVDLAAAEGTPIYATTAGKVTFAGLRGETPTLEIDYGKVNGKSLLMSYGHMKDPAKFVRVGDTVAAGQQIAIVGQEGPANGPHVHLHVAVDGTAIDPLPYFRSLGIPLEDGATRMAEKKDYSSCTVYATAKSGLKKTATNLAPTLRIIAKGEKYTLYPSMPIGGSFVKAKTADGKVGYVFVGRAYVNQPGETQPALKNVGTTKKAVYRMGSAASRHLFDYPTGSTYQKGIIDTIGPNELFSTTGRSYGSYAEVDFGAQRGWIAMDGILYSSSASPLGYVDSAKFNSSDQLVISGWALDRANPSAAGKVKIVIDGKSYTVPATKIREDVHDKYTKEVATAKLGYTWTSPKLPAGNHKVQVYAVGAKSSSTVLNNTAALKVYNPKGNLDSIGFNGAGKLTLKGWAFDKSTPKDSINIEVYVNSKKVSTTKASLSRDDVLKAYKSEISTKNVGFNYTSGVYKAGTYRVQVKLKNTLGGSDVWLVDKKVKNSRTGDPSGGFESAKVSGKKVVVKGWGLDPDAANKSTKVVIYVDGKKHATVTANKTRNDIAKKLSWEKTTKMGFSWTSKNLSKGKHKVKVYVKNVSVGSDKYLGEKTVTIR